MYIRGVGYAIAASLMFGLGVVLGQLVGQKVDAAVVALLALTAGGFLLCGILGIAGTPLFHALSTLRRGDWIDLLLLACPGTAFPLILIVAGLAQTSALVGGFILQLNGVAALLFAVLLLGERFRWRQGVGILLLLVGSGLVIFKGTQEIAWSGSGLGDLLVFLGALGLGFGFVPAKRLAAHVDTLPLTAYRLLLGASILVPIVAFHLLTGIHSLLWKPSLATMGVLAAYIVTSFCFGYLAQQEGFRSLKAWEMGALMQTVPLFSTLFAVLLLHNGMTLLQVGGGLLAICGGLVVALSERALAPPAPPLRVEETSDPGLLPPQK